MRDAPTERQQQLLDRIQEWERLHSCPPTQAELAEACGFRSTNAVRSHVRLLEKKGLIHREPGKARTMRLTVRPGAKRKSKPHGIPLLGTIAAGPLSEAIEQAGEFLEISAGLFRGSDLFALKVAGDSMREAGIQSGDLAIIDHQVDVADGTIAAIWSEEGATLKRVFRKGKIIVLRPANAELEDILIEPGAASTVRILGRLVGIVRREIK